MKIVDLLEYQPYKGMKNVKGTVYLMHLDRPLAHSQHYIGWSTNPDKREEEHQAGQGSAFLKAAKQNGINFEIVRQWHNEDRHFERKLKNRKNARDLCPVCRAERLSKIQLHKPTVVEDAKTVLDTPVTPNVLNQIENNVDELYRHIGIEVNFSNHFRDRAQDPRNGKPITVGELIKIFTSVYKKYSGLLKKAPDKFEAVLTDLSTLLNIPFVLKWNPGTREFDLVAKTVMRKQNFHTPDPKLKVESKINETRLAPLYHTTRIMFLANILTTNALFGNTIQDIDGKQVYGISLTRSLSFANNWGKNHTDTLYATLVLDQQKLAHNHKLVPIDFYTTTAQNAPYTPSSEKIKFKNFRRTGERAESEEFLVTRYLKNLDSYLINILIPKNVYDRLIKDREEYIIALERHPQNNSIKSELQDLEVILKNPKLKITS